jgi:hypothetical protein
MGIFNGDTGGKGCTLWFFVAIEIADLPMNFMVVFHGLLW